MKVLSDHKVVLLDIGDTLVHITEPFEIYTKRALKRCFPHFNTVLSEEKFVLKALTIRNELRANAHKSLNEESIYFFFKLLEREIGKITCTFDELERIYISSELEITKVFDESLEFLKKLKERDHIIIAATNNFSPLHVSLVLEKFDLLPYFNALFISGEVGSRKPNPSFLKLLLEQHNLDLKDCIMIGDKLEMDIASANQIEMSSVWINRSEKPLNPEFTPSFIVQNLLELF